MNYKNYVEYIETARHMAGSSSFIDSCEDFLNKRGYLTEKQIIALENMQHYDDARGVGYDNGDFYKWNDD